MEHYQDLKQIGALAIEESSLNDCANLLKELSWNQEELVQDLKENLTEQIKSNMVNAMMMIQQVPHGTDTDTSTVTTDSLNSVSTLSTLATILSGGLWEIQENSLNSKNWTFR